jgi:hypothetical protein
VLAPGKGEVENAVGFGKVIELPNIPTPAYPNVIFKKRTKAAVTKVKTEQTRFGVT